MNEGSSICWRCGSIINTHLRASIANAMQCINCSNIPFLRAGAGKAPLPLERRLRQMPKGQSPPIIWTGTYGQSRYRGEYYQQRNGNQREHRAAAHHRCRGGVECTLRMRCIGTFSATLLCHNWSLLKAQSESKLSRENTKATSSCDEGLFEACPQGSRVGAVLHDSLGGRLGAVTHHSLAAPLRRSFFGAPAKNAERSIVSGHDYTLVIKPRRPPWTWTDRPDGKPGRGIGEAWSPLL